MERCYPADSLGRRLSTSPKRQAGWICPWQGWAAIPPCPRLHGSIDDVIFSTLAPPWRFFFHRLSDISW
jgi:hypothetical protein